MKRVLFFALILIWIKSKPDSCFAQDQTISKHAESILAAGQKLYDNGQYKLAVDTLEKAVELFEKSNDIRGLIRSLNLRGENFANLNQCDKALELLNNSMQIATAKLKADHPELAQTYYFLSRATGGCARKFDEAIPIMHQSIRMKRKLYGESSEVAFDYTFVGYMFHSKGQYDSALVYLNKSLAIREKSFPLDEVEISNTLYHLGRVYEAQGEVSEALKLQLRSYKIRKEKMYPTHASISNSLHMIGSVYQKLGNVDRALDYYRQALDIRIKSLGENHFNVAGSYFTIGNLYGSMYNYHQAIHYIKRGCAITEKIYGDKSDVLPGYDAYLGRMFGHLGDHKTAKEYFKKAQAMAEKNLRPDHPFLAGVYNIIGEYYADNNGAPKDTEYFKKAVAIFQRVHGPGSVREADVVTRIGVTHAKNKNYSVALDHLNKGLAIYQEKMGLQNPQVASIYEVMGNVAMDQKQYQKALMYYQRAFGAVATDFYDTADLYANPTLAQVDNKPLALRIAVSKGNAIYLQSMRENNGIAKLEKSLQTYQLAMNFIDEMALGYSLENARLELEKQSRKIYNESLTIAYQLFTHTHDLKFIQDAFVIAEKSKAALLLENIRDGRAKTLAGVPDSLIDLERDNKIELAFHQKNLHQAQVKKDASGIALQEKKIFETQQRYDLLKRKIEKQFPAYFNFKYNAIVPSLDRIQRQIQNEQTAVVEFFVADTVIYQITIQKHFANLTKLPKDKSFDQLVRDYDRSLTDASFIFRSRQEADSLYIRSAYALYELLLKNSLESNNEKINKLIIIPDDFLAQFNFGTLLCKQEEDDSPDYQTLGYLTAQCAISYAYAADFINPIPLKNSSTKDVFAGFAPSYSNSQFAKLDAASHPMAFLVLRDGNLPLPGAGKEVRMISQLMNGDSWLEHEANETNFKKYAGDYDILHLAMHSLLNNENPHFSELLFNHEDDTVNDGYLSVAEIYNLKLNAAMIVLSACSSGFGKIQKGEGPISISRAFSYAGCPSVVMSLWKIPDAATVKIMSAFYEELKNGKRKDEALRIAQLKFLSENQDPLYKHPYFWAGFVVMGNTDSIPKPFPWWIIFGIITFLSLMLLLFWFKRRKKNGVIRDVTEVHRQPHI